MKIFTIGGTGMVGSRVNELLSDKHQIRDLSRADGVDIRDKNTLDIIKHDPEHEMIILMAAATDVDKCEIDKKLGEKGDAYLVNVTGVQNIVDICARSNRKLIYISTDFVFDGVAPRNSSDWTGYKEEDSPNPINWYGETKYMGELIVKSSDIDYIIARISYPYRKEFEAKLDFVRSIRARLENNKKVSGVVDHIFCPTFIDDIAHGLGKLIENEETGIFHLTGSQALSPFNAAMMIAKKYGFDRELIIETKRDEYFNGKAKRPFNVMMNNDKVKNLGVQMRGLEEGLESIR